MSWKSATLGVVLGAIAGGSPAWAVCDVDFDIAPAKGLKAAMVRMLEVCPSTQRGWMGNSFETDAGVQACKPVFAAEYDGEATPYRYGESGRCDVNLQSKLVAECSTLQDSEGNPLGHSSGPCHVTSVKAKCSNIENGIQQPIDSVDGIWTLHVLARASIEDRSNRSMTVVDFPMVFEFEPPSNGSLKLKGTSAEALIDTGIDLPPCTILEILDITIRDRDQLSFATMGGATRP